MSNAAFLAAIEKTTQKALPLDQLINETQKLSGTGDPALARQLYQVWISFNADHPLLFIARFNCSTLMQAMGDEAGAEAELTAALAQNPDFAPARINLGTAMERRGRAGDGVEQWRQGIERMAAVTGDAINYKTTLLKQMARVLSDGQQLDAAEIALIQCLDISIDQRDVCEQYAAARLAQCKWPMAPEGGKVTRKHLLSRLHPLSMCAFSDDPMLQLSSGYRYVNHAAPLETRLTRADRRDAQMDPKRKLRIGYVSSDLRHHAVGYLIVNLFEEHDLEEFDIYAYYCGIPTSDPIQDRIKSCVANWRDIRNVSDDAAAAMIAEDEIDILIDVNGHTRDARIGIFARHPAPVQVNWLGYPGTMGTPFHHYLVGDNFVTPEGSEHYYSENILRLPCYQPNDRNRIVVEDKPTRAANGLPDDKFVFCCFNAAHKITRFVFARWMEILKGSPDSVLWLLDYNADTNQRLRERAAEAGIDPARLIFAPKLQNAYHLARYPLADLVIDTAPYGAHTTASDAMWMGVPVLTWAGRSFAARVCGSLVRSAGLPELVCDSADAFIAKAIALSTGERLTLAALRQRLADNRDTCALFDIARLTRSLEDLYRQMRATHLAGLTPKPNLTNLDAYFDIGVAIDHEAREIGQLTDYEGFWRDLLAKRHMALPLPADGRIWREEDAAPMVKAKLTRAA